VGFDSTPSVLIWGRQVRLSDLIPPGNPVQFGRLHISLYVSRRIVEHFAEPKLMFLPSAALASLARSESVRSNFQSVRYPRPSFYRLFVFWCRPAMPKLWPTKFFLKSILTYCNFYFYGHKNSRLKNPRKC